MPPVRPCAAGVLLLLTFASGLAAQRPLPVDTLHVTAASRLIAGSAGMARSVDVIDRAAIDALPARSVTDVIARTLGADLMARSSAQADLSIRGSSFEQILILVDGVPSNDRQTGHFHLDTAVPLDAVERIEVVRGPASALYGTSAVGGVINIVTRRGSGVSAHVRGGSFGSMAAGVDGGGTIGGLSARIGAERDVSDGHRPGTDHRMTLTRITIGAPVLHGTLRAGAGHAARDFGANGFYAPFDSYEETRTTTAHVSWRSRPAAFVLDSRIAYRRHDDDFILQRADPSFYRNIHVTRETTGEVVARLQPAGRLALAAGVEAGRSTIESNSLGDRAEHRHAAFAEAAAGDADASLLTVGLRLDRHSTFGAFPSVSASAAHRVTAGVRLRASGATGYRAPSWTDRYYEDPANIGSADLEAEQFWTAEAGATLNAHRVQLDLAGFVRRAHDLIDWARPAGAPETEPWRTLNVQEATFRGLELTARSYAGPIGVIGRAALLSFDASAGAGLISKYALQPLTRSASLELAGPVAPYAEIGLRGTANRRADGQAWEVVDLRLSGGSAAVRVFADITNVFDASWLDVSARPAAGRAFSFGLRARR